MRMCKISGVRGCVRSSQRLVNVRTSGFTVRSGNRLRKEQPTNRGNFLPERTVNFFTHPIETSDTCSLNRLLCGLSRPFRRTVKLGETPGDRAARILQTRLESAPKSVTRCKAMVETGNSLNRTILGQVETCDVLARKGLFGNLLNSLLTQNSYELKQS
jgi:hypothetical protein